MNRALSLLSVSAICLTQIASAIRIDSLSDDYLTSNDS